MKTANLGPFALAALAVVLLAAPSPAQELTLAENGVAKAPIVVFENAPPFTRQAADELAEYIERISGARPEVIEGRPDPVPEPAIWVGHQAILDEIFPDLDFDFQHPEEILVAANESQLVVAGRDRWTPNNDRQQEYGTANAVYTFLQDYLDVRWLWPGPTGTDVVERDTIAFAPFEYRYHPRIRGRNGIVTFARLGGRGTISAEWVQFQRLRLDSFDLPGGHAFTTYWERFSKTKPEIFALQPDGTRGGGEAAWPSARTVKMCLSNPELWRLWLQDVEAQLEANPDRTVFNASPNDGWFSGWCVCENCLAWDHPEGELRTFRWRNVVQQHVALSDRQVTFYNQLARLLREQFPDRTLYVRGGGYGHARPAPIGVAPDENVIISSVANFFLRSFNADRGSSAGTLHREQYAAWGEVAPNLVWRPNTGSPVGWQAGLPDVPLSEAARDVKSVFEHGCMGIFIDSVWEHWATQGPLYYMMAHLAWNPERDVEEIMTDYYQRGFGEASGEIEAYWTLLEEKREEYFYADPTDGAWTGRPGTRSFQEVYDEEFFDKAYGLLERAAQAVAGEPQIYGQRVEYTRAGLDYTRLMLDSREAVRLWEESEKTDTEARERSLANWDKIIQIYKEHPDAMNWRRLEPRHGRTAAFHPDGRDADVGMPR